MITITSRTINIAFLFYTVHMNIDTIKYNFKDILAVAAMTGSSVYENELTRLANLKVYRDEHVSIQSIFAHYWDAFKAKYEPKLRPTIIENVEKMIKCRNLKYGYLFFECPSVITIISKGYLVILAFVQRVTKNIARHVL